MPLRFKGLNRDDSLLTDEAVVLVGQILGCHELFDKCCFADALTTKHKHLVHIGFIHVSFWASCRRRIGSGFSRIVLQRSSVVLAVGEERSAYGRRRQTVVVGQLDARSTFLAWHRVSPGPRRRVGRRPATGLGRAVFRLRLVSSAHFDRVSAVHDAAGLGGKVSDAVDRYVGWRSVRIQLGRVDRQLSRWLRRMVTEVGRRTRRTTGAAGPSTSRHRHVPTSTESSMSLTLTFTRGWPRILIGCRFCRRRQCALRCSLCCRPIRVPSLWHPNTIRVALGVHLYLNSYII